MDSRERPVQGAERVTLNLRPQLAAYLRSQKPDEMQFSQWLSVVLMAKMHEESVAAELVAEAKKLSTELAAEAEKRAEELAVKAKRHAEELSAEAKRQAAELAAEVKRHAEAFEAMVKEHSRMLAGKSSPKLVQELEEQLANTLCGM